MDFDGPVCLTRSAPHEAFSGQLIFYDVIDSAAIARSGVLSCIVEAGGEAVLPDSITLAEFKTWLTKGDATIAEAEKWSFPLFCTLMKVGRLPGSPLQKRLLSDTWLSVHVEHAALHEPLVLRYSGCGYAR